MRFCLLAYYIASVNIEMAFHQRGARAYKPFPNISLTDTFELFEKQDVAFPAFLGDNNDRLEKQKTGPDSRCGGESALGPVGAGNQGMMVMISVSMKV